MKELGIKLPSTKDFSNDIEHELLKSHAWQTVLQAENELVDLSVET